MKPLLELLLAEVATHVKGLTEKEILSHFKIERDFSPEEYEELKKEYQNGMEASTLPTALAGGASAGGGGGK